MSFYYFNAHLIVPYTYTYLFNIELSFCWQMSLKAIEKYIYGTQCIDMHKHAKFKWLRWKISNETCCITFEFCNVAI